MPHELAALAAVLVLALLGAGCASTGPGGAGGPVGPQTLRELRAMAPPGMDLAWLHFTEATVEVGATAPDFTLPTPDGRTMLSLSSFEGRPLVLVFGSRT